jgi:serine/threonine protein kinase
VLRISGLVSPNTISTQVAAIDKLSVSRHENILEVLKHGWLSNSYFYFFDMEFCDVSLDSAIKEGDISHLRRSGVERIKFSDWLRSTFRIARQIIDGLAFIHRSGEIHRGLKPSNGK